jgi:phospholipid/cholesterol/gamma-HCH transport system permease protein
MVSCAATAPACWSARRFSGHCRGFHHRPRFHVSDPCGSQRGAAIGRAADFHRPDAPSSLPDEFLIMLEFLAAIGRITLASMAMVGRLAFFTGVTLSHLVRPPFYGMMLLRQMVSVGYNSLVVVGLTAVFTGMVLALQSYTGFSRSFESESAIALIVLIAVTRELGPVIAGLMVAGRVGAAIAAEIGTMRVTDQIDALTTLSTNPMKYLVVPRVVAGLLTMPLLVLIADIIGVAGGYLVASYKLGFNPNAYLTSTMDYLKTEDVVSGLVKAAVFGFIITLMGCYHGYNSRGGAQGVGAATTAAVVSASITILLTDYLLTSLFFYK